MTRISQWGCRLLFPGLMTVILPSFISQSLRAQVAGSGTIRGTITDQTGAVIQGATVTAVQNETGIKYVRQSSDAGVYTVSPVLPGHYSLTVTAPGFETLTQDNIIVDASTEVGMNLKLHPGSVSETVTVTTAPLELQTENATLGVTIDQRTVDSIPMIMSNDQRMATSLAMFVPGVQENPTSGTPSYTGTASSTDSGIINGSGPGGDVSEIYIDGLPESGGDGDPRYVWTAISMDAVSQMHFETAGYPATEQGMGTENFQIKSGTSQWHGSAFEYVRNTILDTWGFFQPGVTVKNAQGQVVQEGKPAEHQNEFGATLSGPLYKKRIFFFGDYDGYRESLEEPPLYEQIPNVAETQGDFSEMLQAGGLGYQLYDPHSVTCTTPGNPATCSRTAIPNNQLANMTGGTARISSISQAMESAGMLDLAQQANQTVPIGSNNFLATTSGGLNNWSMTGKLDVNLTDSHKIAVVYAEGRQASTGIGTSGTNQAPPPYTNAHGYAPKTKVVVLEDVYTLTPHLVNELKYGVGRYYAPEINFSNNSSASAAKIGIGGLPTGQIQTSFPTVSFGGSSGTFPNEWGNQTAYITVATDFSLMDNVQYVRGKQAITAGVQWQWLQNNESNPLTGTSQLTLNYSSKETGALTANNVPGTTGFSYASFLLGAVDSASFTQQVYKTTGLRLHPFSLYVQDDIKLTPKLTVNAGVRWDLYPPFHAAQNLFSFLNPNGVNPYSGYPGSLEFAGTGNAPLFCNCKTPANTYFGNFGPRLGAAYTLNNKTVLHAAFGIMYAHSQGTGITTSFEQGSGILGYAATPSFTNTDTADYPGLPAFWLNPNGPTTVTTNGGAQYGSSIPSYTFPLTLNAGLGTYYSNILPAGQITSSMNYLDPRLGGRSPEFVNYTIGFQRALLKGITANVNYVANHGHFLAVSGNRGKYINQAAPAYLVELGPISSAANPKSSILSSTVATSADLAKAQALFPNLTVDPTFLTTQAISQLIKPFPQYSGISDAFDSDGNTSYNALQLSLTDRTPIRGLTFTMNWTWEKLMDDLGTYRSGYEPRSAEWSLGTTDIPQQITGYAVYDIPAGKGHLVGWDNPLVDQIVGGWRVSGVITYATGSPLAVTTGGCTTSGTCMPNLTPGYNGSPRKNGGYGSKGITWSNASTRQYIDPTAFTTPTSYTYGNAPRTAPYNLFGPGNHDVDMSLRRSFKMYRESELVLQADLYNVFNNVIFGGLNTTLTNGTATQGNTPITTYAPSTTASFGTFSKQANLSRDAQLSMHINF
jgi:hypothetical protein